MRVFDFYTVLNLLHIIWFASLQYLTIHFIKSISCYITVPGSGGTSRIDATAEQRKLDVQYAYGWYNNITRDVFK